MDNQTAVSIINKNIIIFQNYLLYLHTILNHATMTNCNNFQAQCHNIIKMTSFIEECGQNVLKVCQSRENYTPWKKVPSRKRTKSHDQENTKRAKLE